MRWIVTVTVTLVSTATFVCMYVYSDPYPYKQKLQFHHNCVISDYGVGPRPSTINQVNVTGR